MIYLKKIKCSIESISCDLNANVRPLVSLIHDHKDDSANHRAGGLRPEGPVQCGGPQRGSGVRYSAHVQPSSLVIESPDVLPEPV